MDKKHKELLFYRDLNFLSDRLVEQGFEEYKITTESGIFVWVPKGGKNVVII